MGVGGVRTVTSMPARPSMYCMSYGMATHKHQERNGSCADIRGRVLVGPADIECCTQFCLLLGDRYVFGRNLADCFEINTHQTK